MSRLWWCMGPINCATGSRLRDLGQAPAAEVGKNDECCPTSPIRSPLPSMCQITHILGAVWAFLWRGACLWGALDVPWTGQPLDNRYFTIITIILATIIANLMKGPLFQWSLNDKWLLYWQITILNIGSDKMPLDIYYSNGMVISVLVIFEYKNNQITNNNNINNTFQVLLCSCFDMHVIKPY